MTQMLWWIQRSIGSAPHDLHQKLPSFQLLIHQALVEFLTQALDKLVCLFLGDKADAPIDLSRDGLADDLLSNLRAVNAPGVIPDLLTSLI